ncbi:hypothetical protein [Pontibacter sp. G13]|uniref:hypothetical protein n=1 Tax=Pontibacter sp. G13 TaxID=3074898 RepID=UPI00288B88A2|nr:hypothetical protein [Pontibacter sp. G13]WNJ19574.1 hypothetical protein RJD25_03715 [Pontibacter sp. G13]
MHVRNALQKLLPIFLLVSASLISLPLQAQRGPSMQGKTVGIYISSKRFTIDERLYLGITQFLKQGSEDRSWVGQLKSELIIQLGWMLSEQIQEMTQADTVYFINAVPELAKPLISQYDPISKTLVRKSNQLDQLDYVMVMDSVELKSRIEKSVYIQSNRVKTDRVVIPKVELAVCVLSPRDPKTHIYTEVCYDDQNKPHLDLVFDFHRQKSKTGKYLSRAFSYWWDLFNRGQSFPCFSN